MQYRQLDEEVGIAEGRVRTGLTGSDFLPGPNDVIRESFMPSPRTTEFLPGAGSRAMDFLPTSGPRASDFLPDRVPLPAAGGYVRGYDGFDAEWYLPAQPSKGDSALDTEFTLLSREHPSTASRVERLPLTHGERDMVSYALRRADEFATTAREWSSLGNRLYTAQIVAAASVPVRVCIMRRCTARATASLHCCASPIAPHPCLREPLSLSSGGRHACRCSSASWDPSASLPTYSCASSPSSSPSQARSAPPSSLSTSSARADRRATTAPSPCTASRTPLQPLLAHTLRIPSACPPHTLCSLSTHPYANPSAGALRLR